MKPHTGTDAFAKINQAYDSVFQVGQLSIGIVVPIENYVRGSRPTMTQHLERVLLAEELGFSAVWLRDVPFDVPSFGDAGQMFDPFVYLGLLAGRTSRIALGVSSVILPLRHPAHVAKAAASVDELSDGRLLLGIASGDRPDEYPAMAIPFADRGERFRQSYEYIRGMAEPAPSFENAFGSPGGGMEMVPKPAGGRLPLLVTGASQQDSDWIARHGDGKMLYPREPVHQATVIADYRSATKASGQSPKPVMQPFHIDLDDNPDEPPELIHLGFKSGMNPLIQHLDSLRDAGVNHVALNLRFNQAGVEETLTRLAADLLPHFHRQVSDND